MMDDLENQKGTSSILHQALCIIWKPSVNSNWSYSLEMLNSGQNWWFFLYHVTLKYDQSGTKSNLVAKIGNLWA